MIDVIFGVAMKLSTILLDIAFLSVLFTRKNKRGTNEYIGLVSGSAFLVIITTLLQSYALVRLFLVFVAMTIMMKFYLGLSFKESVIGNAIFEAICVCCEFVALLLLRSTVGVTTFEKLTNSNGAFYIELLSYVLVLIIILLIGAMRGKTNLSRMDIRGWIIFSLFPLFTLYAIAVFVNQVDEQSKTETVTQFIILGIGMFLLNLGMFFLLNNVISRECEIAEQQRLVENAEYVYKLYESLSKESEIHKSQAHDYMNHLNAMYALALAGDYEEQKRYISEQIRAAADVYERFDTGNSIVNAVINRKYQEANRKEIIFPIISDDLSAIDISDSALVTILSNIIDNAIEAAEKCIEKKIILKIKLKDGNLYIDSENTRMSYDGDDGYFKTTKEDRKNHGYGLLNIEKAVSDNGGTCTITGDGDKFHIFVILPL